MPTTLFPHRMLLYSEPINYFSLTRLMLTMIRSCDMQCS